MKTKTMKKRPTILIVMPSAWTLEEVYAWVISNPRLRELYSRPTVVDFSWALEVQVG